MLENASRKDQITIDYNYAIECRDRLMAIQSHKLDVMEDAATAADMWDKTANSKSIQLRVFHHINLNV